MARSEVRPHVNPAAYRIAAAVVLACLAAACGGDPPPVSAAPYPVNYTCEQSKRMAAEYAAMAPDSMGRRYLDDYGTERRGLRALYGLPEPNPCKE